MKESFWGILIIVIGLISIFLINVFQNITTTNDQNYYLLREATEAAMFEAIDLGYYRQTGKVKIVQEKFVENFVRRFAESANSNNNYNIKFYEIIECPPKVSLQVGSSAATFSGEDFEDFDIVNRLDGILESK